MSLESMTMISPKHVTPEAINQLFPSTKQINRYTTNVKHKLPMNAKSINHQHALGHFVDIHSEVVEENSCIRDQYKFVMDNHEYHLYMEKIANLNIDKRYQLLHSVLEISSSCITNVTVDFYYDILNIYNTTKTNTYHQASVDARLRQDTVIKIHEPFYPRHRYIYINPTSGLFTKNDTCYLNLFIDVQEPFGGHISGMKGKSVMSTYSTDTSHMYIIWRNMYLSWTEAEGVCVELGGTFTKCHEQGGGRFIG